MKSLTAPVTDAPPPDVLVSIGLAFNASCQLRGDD